MISLPVLEERDLWLERDPFLRTMLRELSGTLSDIVGEEEAAGFISVVGRRIGDRINETYRSSLQVSRIPREVLSRVLVDLKRRIQGDFFVVEETDEKIVLGNRACPFGEHVEGRPSLCMMTSNVFGVIAAENVGYAKVSLEKMIAQGDRECRIIIYLSPGGDGDAAEGREYFPALSD